MWLIPTALAGVPNVCAPPVVVPFLEEHLAVGEYLRAGHHPIAVEQLTHDGDTALLWVRCQALMGEQTQLVAWKRGDAPMEAVGLGYRAPGLDLWFERVELSVVDVGWPDATAIQVSGPFTVRSEQRGFHSDDMVVWAVGYPELDERRRFGDIATGPRHGEGCPDRGVPNGLQTELWIPRTGRTSGDEAWRADATVTTTHSWSGDVLELEERWTPADASATPSVVRRTVSWQHGGLHEVCRTE